MIDLVKTFIVSSPASFLLPKVWQRYEYTLRTIVGATDTTLCACFRDLCKRNARLQTLADSSRDSELTVHQMIIGNLDTLLSFHTDINRAARDLWDMADDPNLLVQVCLEWSASIYRYCHSRVYIAARLLRKWSGLGIDVETPIFEFIATRSDACGLELSSFYRVIVELVRSRHFSVGRYLQWVIANGVLSEYDTSKVVRCNCLSRPYNLLIVLQLPCAVGLIFAIPLDGLPSHIQNLRQNLLRSIGVSTAEEKCRIAQIKTLIDRQLRSEAKENKSPTAFDPPLFCHSQESMTVKSSVGHWIREKVIDRPESQQADLEQRSLESHPRPGASSQLCNDASRLRTLIAALEDLDDYPTMATVLTRCSTYQDPHVLALATVTICHHLDYLAAMGVADKIFMQIFRQQATLKTQSGRMSLIEGLIDLAKSLPNRMGETRALQKDLQKYSSKVSIAACSPISEHMVEALQSDESKSISACTDEVEQLLASGTSMDKRLLSSVFDMFWKRFEATWTDSVQLSVAAASLLSRLRAFDANVVDELINLTLGKTLASQPRPKLMRIGMPLVCAQSISLEHLLGRVSQLLRGSDASGAHGELLIETIALLTAGREKVESSISHVSGIPHTPVSC